MPKLDPQLAYSLGASPEMIADKLAEDYNTSVGDGPKFDPNIARAAGKSNIDIINHLTKPTAADLQGLSEGDFRSGAAQSTLGVPPPADTSASFRAAMGNSLLKDKDAKLRMFADIRGVSPDHYKWEGDTLLFNDGNKWVKEGAGGLKDLGADIATRPVTTLTAPLVAAGPVGLAAKAIAQGLLGGGEEFGRQWVGNNPTAMQTITGSNITNGPRAPIDSAIDIGAAALGNAAAGAFLPAGIDKLRMAGTKPGLDALRGMSEEQLAQIMTRANAAHGAGIPLTIPELTGDSAQLAQQIALQQRVGGSQVLSPFLTQRNAEVIPQAVDGLLSSLGPRGDALGRNVAIRNGAQSIMDGIQAEKKAVTGPMFDAAKGSEASIDVTPIVSSIDDLLRNEVGVAKSKLLEVRDMLTGGQPSNLPTPAELRAAGKSEAVINSMQRQGATADGTFALTTEQALPILNHIDSLIPEKSITNPGEVANLRRVLSGTRGKLSETLKDTNDQYAKAVAASKEFVDMKQGLLGSSNLESILGAASPARAAMGGTPDVAANTVAQLVGENPELRNALVQSYLGNAWDGVPINSPNRGMMFAKNASGTPGGQANLDAVLGPNTSVADLMDVLNQTGRGVYGNSQTALNSALQRRDELNATGFLRSMIPGQQNNVFNRLSQVLSDRSTAGAARDILPTNSAPMDWESVLRSIPPSAWNRALSRAGASGAGLLGTRAANGGN